MAMVPINEPDMVTATEGSVAMPSLAVDNWMRPVVGTSHDALRL